MADMLCENSRLLFLSTYMPRWPWQQKPCSQQGMFRIFLTFILNKTHIPCCRPSPTLPRLRYVGCQELHSYLPIFRHFFSIITYSLFKRQLSVFPRPLAIRYPCSGTVYYSVLSTGADKPPTYSYYRDGDIMHRI